MKIGNCRVLTKHNMKILNKILNYFLYQTTHCNVEHHKSFFSFVLCQAFQQHTKVHFLQILDCDRNDDLLVVLYNQTFLQLIADSNAHMIDFDLMMLFPDMKLLVPNNTFHLKNKNQFLQRVD